MKIVNVCTKVNKMMISQSVTALTQLDACLLKPEYLFMVKLIPMI